MLNRSVVVNLFGSEAGAHSYLWLGGSAIKEAGFIEGTPYYQSWEKGKAVFSLDPTQDMQTSRKVNLHKKGPVVRAEGKHVMKAFDGFKSVKADISPGRIEFVGHEAIEQLEALAA